MPLPPSREWTADFWRATSDNIYIYTQIFLKLFTSSLEAFVLRDVPSSVNLKPIREYSSLVVESCKRPGRAKRRVIGAVVRAPSESVPVQISKSGGMK